MVVTKKNYPLIVIALNYPIKKLRKKENYWFLADVDRVSGSWMAR